MSDDGFSGADPADVPPSMAGGDTAQQTTGSVTVISDDVDCTNCIHFDVCAYYDGIENLLKSRDSPPIKATDIAKICDEYTPESGPTDQ